MVAYFDLPAQGPIARQRFSMPDWFDWFTIVEERGPGTETTRLDNAQSDVVVEKRYTHKGGRCYRIDEYCVYGWRITTWTGRIVYRLRVDQGRIRTAIREAQLLALRCANHALADYVDPTSGAAGGAVDLAVQFAHLPLPAIFGDLAGVVDLSQLLSALAAIQARAEAVIRELERLLALDGSIVSSHDAVVWERQWDRVKTFSSVTIVEVECAPWILEVPDGETLRVPGHDEWLAPTAAGDGLDRALHGDAPPDHDAVAPRELPPGAREVLRARRKLATPGAGGPERPREAGGKPKAG